MQCSQEAGPVWAPKHEEKKMKNAEGDNFKAAVPFPEVVERSVHGLVWNVRFAMAKSDYWY